MIQSTRWISFIWYRVLIWYLLSDTEYSYLNIFKSTKSWILTFQVRQFNTIVCLLWREVALSYRGCYSLSIRRKAALAFLHPLHVSCLSPCATSQPLTSCMHACQTTGVGWSWHCINGYRGTDEGVEYPEEWSWPHVWGQDICPRYQKSALRMMVVPRLHQPKIHCMVKVKARILDKISHHQTQR